jgi:hypothetical protein
MFLELLSCALNARKDVVQHLEMITEDKNKTLSEETTFSSEIYPVLINGEVEMATQARARY